MKVTLTRQTRIYWPPNPAQLRDAASENRWHAYGPLAWGKPLWEAESTVSGPVDVVGGFLIDIRVMDQLLWEVSCEVTVALGRQDRIGRQLPNPGSQPKNGDSVGSGGELAGPYDFWQIEQWTRAVWERLRERYQQLNLAQETLQLEAPPAGNNGPHPCAWLSPGGNREGTTPCPSPAASSEAISLDRLVWRVSPYQFLTYQAGHESAGSIFREECVGVPVVPVAITQQYEFAAAHRLHCPQWSQEQNQAVFGKCNHPSGHGHNYRVDVTVQWCPPPVPGGDATQSANEAGESLQPAFDALHRVVQDCVIRKLDHRLLNLDVPEFFDVNPTVENIAQVAYKWLIDQIPAPLQLQGLRVYETEKTWAEISVSPGTRLP